MYPDGWFITYQTYHFCWLIMFFSLTMIGISCLWIIILRNISAENLGYCTYVQPMADWCKLGIFTQNHQILASLRMNMYHQPTIRILAAIGDHGCGAAETAPAEGDSCMEKLASNHELGGRLPCGNQTWQSKIH